MKTRINHLRRYAVAALLAGLLLACMARTAAADVRFFGITKGNYLLQTNASAPVALPESSYEVHAFAELNVPNSLITATAKWPNNGPLKPLTNGITAWRYRERFTSQINMNFGAPNGTYQFNFQTTSDGAKSSSLTLSADFYPVPVHIANFAAAQEIDWRNDFVLTWPANSTDFFHFRIMDGPVLVYETGSWPGAPNAMPARASSVIIPRNTLAEGRKYSARITAWVRSTADSTSYPGALGWAAYTRTTDFPIQTAFAVNDVVWVGLYKKQNFVQSSPAVPVPAATAPFEMVGNTEAADPLSVLTASVKFPNNIQRALLGAGPKWNWAESFPSQAALDTAFPNGNCEFTVETRNNGLRQLSIPLANTTWANQPHLNNWPAVNLVQPGQPFTLSWFGIVGATADDFIQVRIRQNGQVLFKTGDHPRATDALKGTATSVVIPGAIFQPGQAYEASVLFLKVTHTDPFSYPRTLLNAGYARETAAQIRTRGGDHPRPVISSLVGEGNTVRLTIDSAAPGWYYGLEKSADLKAWANILLTNAPASRFDLLLNREAGPVFLRTLVH